MQYKNRYFYYSILPCLLLLITIGVYVSGYNPPTQGPPYGNLPAPINAGPDSQTKAGSLTIGGNLTTGSFTMSAGAGADKVLTTNASGVATWQTAAGDTSAAGETGYVQFNDDSIFAAVSTLFWDNINKRLGIGTTEPQSKLDIRGDLLVPAADTELDCDGFVTTGKGICDFHADGIDLVHTEAADNLCTDNPELPTIIFLHTGTKTTQCNTTNGTVTNLLGIATASTGYYPVGGHWAFVDSGATADTYDDGEDLYIDNVPKGTFLGSGTGNAYFGNVGIGTVEPAEKLSVHNSTSQGAIGISGFGDDNRTYSALYLHDDTADLNNNWAIAHKKGIGLYNENDLHIVRWITSDPRLSRTDITIDSETGNVGIGAMEPGSKLEVNGSISTGSGNGIKWVIANGNLGAINTVVTVSLGLTPSKVLGGSASVLLTQGQALPMTHDREGILFTAWEISSKGNLEIVAKNVSTANKPFRVIVWYIE